MQRCTFHYLLYNSTTWDEIDLVSREATDYDARGIGGSTILTFVVRNVPREREDFHSDLMRRLVERGVDVDARTEHGLSAIDYVDLPWPTILLIELGASIDAVRFYSRHLKSRRSVRLAVLSTPKFCEDMARMVAEMVT